MSCAHKHEIIESAANLLNFMSFVVMSVETFLTSTAARVVTGRAEDGLCVWTTMCLIYHHVEMNP